MLHVIRGHLSNTSFSKVRSFRWSREGLGLSPLFTDRFPVLEHSISSFLLKIARDSLLTISCTSLSVAPWRWSTRPNKSPGLAFGRLGPWARIPTLGPWGGTLGPWGGPLGPWGRPLGLWGGPLGPCGGPLEPWDGPLEPWDGQLEPWAGLDPGAGRTAEELFCSFSNFSSKS